MESTLNQLVFIVLVLLKAGCYFSGCAAVIGLISGMDITHN